MKYRKKPVVVEAYLYTGDISEAISWILKLPKVDAGTEFNANLGGLSITTLEGKMHVSDGDYIICGTKGELYPCKPDVFVDVYEPVDDVQEKG